MNKSKLSHLRRRVAMRSRKKAYESIICWRRSVVGIQDILLDETPSAYMGPMNVRIKKAEYENILANWKKNFIGGEKKFHHEEMHAYWQPPKGAKIFPLETGLPPMNENFYILYLENGGYVFLQKLNSYDRRKEEDLRIIEGWEDDVAGQLFEHTLEYALRTKKN